MAKVQAIIGSEFPDKVIPLIRKAQGSISILVFDWRWYPDSPESPVQIFNQAIVQAKLRGVTIKVIANHLDIVDRLKRLKIDARKAFSKTLVHSKLMIIDETVCVLGSHNYTASAFNKNFECSVIITGQEEVAPFLNYFNKIFTYDVGSRSL